MTFSVTVLDAMGVECSERDATAELRETEVNAERNMMIVGMIVMVFVG